MNSTDSKKTIVNFLKGLLIADVVWAAMLATLQSLFLGQAGVVIGANGVATTVAVGASWLMTFAVGLFQGAVLLFFIALLFGLWAFAYHALTKTLDKTAQIAIGRIFLGILVADIIWALLNGVYAAAIVAGLGSAPAISASAPVLVSASVLSFIVSFTMGIFTGAVVLTILGVFVFVVGSLWAFFSNKR